MSETVFVTGATGLAGANICKLLLERGDTVRALAREGADTGPLVDLGVDVVTGDVTDADDVLRAATGCDSAIHCAALLGGASQDLARLPGRQRGRDQARARRRRGSGHAPGGGRQHRHLLRHLRRSRAGGRPRVQGAQLRSLHHHQDGRLRGRHGPGGRRPGRGHHPPGSHLRPLPGGQQCARADQLQPGAALRPCASASSRTCGFR